MPRVTADEIPLRFTIYLPDLEDRQTLCRIINRHGTSQTGGIRIALRDYARNNPPVRSRKMSRAGTTLSC